MYTGHTIVGDGTTAQLSGMLTGIAEENQPEARRSMPNSKTCDGWRLLFKDFKKNGYATFFSEDSPSVGTFTYRLKGFSVPPTDHYGRPGWLEGDSLTHGYCAGTQATHRIQFKYLHSMLKEYKNPKFAFTLLSGLTHDNENSLGYADDDLKELLQNLKKEGFTNNSMIVIFGDHGFRFAVIRKTLQGKLEERLPHMAISLPSWFPRRFPHLFNSLQDNSNLLTTPFDMYATMKHILSYPKQPDGIITGQSLFTPIDASKRACSNNGVEDHWCPCLNWHDLSVDDALIKEIVHYVVKYMNDMVAVNSVASKLCARLSLKKINSAQQQLPNEKMQTFLHSKRDHRCDSCGVVAGSRSENTLARDTVYQVQFTTSPNNGLYEVSVKLTKGNPSLAGDISRVDRYGSQPDCIKTTYTHLVKFCLCNQQ